MEAANQHFPTRAGFKTIPILSKWVSHLKSAPRQWRQS